MTWFEAHQARQEVRDERIDKVRRLKRRISRRILRKEIERIEDGKREAC